MDKKIICAAFILSFFSLNGFSQSEEFVSAGKAAGHVSKEDATISSKSAINWTKAEFSTDIELDIEKSGIPLPSGKASCINKIEMETPILIKDPLLSIYVDDNNTLGDLVLNGNVTLEELTKIIDNSQETPPVFRDNGKKLVTKQTINLLDIGSTLVKHKNSYNINQPIKTISSRKYTGIIIDCRGTYPVQGEYIESKTYPCLFPKIWNESMELIYEKNMVNPEIAKTKGIVYYSSSQNFEDYSDRVGNDPLWISAEKVFGINRCDPVISNEDYLKITSVKENFELLTKGKIVILLDENQLAYDVAVPDKNKNYYALYDNMKRFLQEKHLEEIVVEETTPGISITMQNLMFKADSDELVEKDKQRVAEIAKALLEYTSSAEYKIVVEGHTADVNKPEGQMNLSNLRAKTVADMLVNQGIDKEIISYRGFGGTKPVASNATAEGRAQNRRVEIIIIPKTTYVMRQ